jgi:hypothetical protein
MLTILMAALQMQLPAPPAEGVYHGRLNQTTVAIPKRGETEIKIDGVLNEAAWAQAAMLTGFSQYSPVDGLPAEDSTEVLVWYTDHEIYLGVRAFEPHGSVRATLADRDRISADDYVGFLLDTFNDRRQALLFLVNPLGVQGDGVINETQRGSNEDHSPDYLFQSKGRQTDFGYEIEIRIPFKSLRYPAKRVQDWGLHVYRRVQHSGQDQSWVPALKGRASLLAQAGTLKGLTELKRGLVMDINPVATTKYSGARVADATITDPRLLQYDYKRGDPELGLNLRWGVTTNLTMNATVNPDFSQVEADAGQINFDPRSSISFPEKRPFFLENIDQFNTPSRLVYTRRIVEPEAAAKFTGKVLGADIGFLSAVDDTLYSRTGDHPVYNILRMRRNIGRQGSVAMLYTDKIDGDDYNRVLGVDGRLVFKNVYTLGYQAAGSFWKTGTRSEKAPLWNVSLDRNGRRFGMTSTFSGIHQYFVPGAGFISRANVAHANVQPRINFYGKPDSKIQVYTLGLTIDGTWDYDEFERGIGPDDEKLHLNNDWALRGGWRIGFDVLLESFRYPARFYSNYRVEMRDANGVPVDTVPFVGRRRIPNYDIIFNLSTPQYPRFSANMFVAAGRDENFEEWAPGWIMWGDASVRWRPTDQIRAEVRYVEQRTHRVSDNSLVRLSRIPRLKVEYQVSRPFFVRVVGQYTADQRDQLFDVARSGNPILICRGNTCTRGDFNESEFRADVLLSYQPNPGTVIFAGYGSSSTETEAFRFRDLFRTSDGFFVKLSYLFRL